MYSQLLPVLFQAKWIDHFPVRLDAVIAKGAMPHNRDGKATSTPLVMLGMAHGSHGIFLQHLTIYTDYCSRDSARRTNLPWPSPRPLAANWSRAVKLQDVIVTITTNDESHSSILAISCRLENYNIYSCVYAVIICVCVWCDWSDEIHHCTPLCSVPFSEGPRQTLHLQVTALRSVQVEARRA